MSVPEYSVDYIPVSRLQDLGEEETIDFVLDRVASERVLILQTALNPQMRLNLVQKGLERFQNEFIGIKMLLLNIRSESGGVFRKSRESSILIVAPGNASIDQSEDGDVSVKFPPPAEVSAQTAL